PNLTILTRATTLRILVERGRAIGVEYRRQGRSAVARAAREVLLCGGALNSPQLLLLSGIGPADELKPLGIAPLHDLPGVGRNLNEHPNLTVAWRLHRADSFTKFLRLDRATLGTAQWFLTRTGPFTNSGAAANMYLRSRPERLELNCRVGALHPESRGWVKLRSADPLAHPLIQFNLLTAPEDMATMIRGVRIAREIYAQEPVARLLGGELFPGAEAANDAEIAAAIRARAGHRSHPVGTCAMGIGDDAVVDSRLRVRGLDSLRVVDASVMPDVIGGNTNVPTIMIAEKAADLIRGRSLPPAEIPVGES